MMILRWPRCHPLTVFADYGAEGSGEPLAVVLRPGNAGSNTAADHIEAARLGLAQLPRHQQRRVLIASTPAAAPLSPWTGWPSQEIAYLLPWASPSPEDPRSDPEYPARA